MRKSVTLKLEKDEAALLTTDMAADTFDFPGDEQEGGLAILQAAVQGTVEMYRPPGADFELWFNEEGGPEIKNMPINLLASILLATVVEDSRPMYGPVIVRCTHSLEVEIDVLEVAPKV